MHGDNIDSRGPGRHARPRGVTGRQPGPGAPSPSRAIAHSHPGPDALRDTKEAQVVGAGAESGIQPLPLGNAGGRPGRNIRGDREEAPRPSHPHALEPKPEPEPHAKGESLVGTPPVLQARGNREGHPQPRAIRLAHAAQAPPEAHGRRTAHRKPRRHARGDAKGTGPARVNPRPGEHAGD